jgi:hypothetical protein
MTAATKKLYIGWLYLGKPGIDFHVWSKYKKERAKLGTLQVTAGGIRWKPNQGKKWIRKSWDQISEWLES